MIPECIDISLSIPRAFRRLVCGYECCICGGHLSVFSQSRIPLCLRCFSNLEYITGRYCRYCGYPLISENPETGFCMKCRDRDRYHDGSRSLFFYDSKEYTFLEQYKFEYRREFSYLLAKIMYCEIMKSYPGYTVIAVPSNPESIKVRGWGHMEEILRVLETFNVKTASRVLERKKGGSQKTRTKDQRLLLGPECIDYSPGKVPPGERILIIDDVYTTGSTLDLCSSKIKRCQPQAINCLTLYRD